MKNALFWLCLLISASAFAQPDSLWSEIYGWVGGDCSGATLLTTGDYLLVGMTRQDFDIPYWDILAAKADSAGNEIWTRTYGRHARGQRRNDEYAFTVTEWTDNKILVGGKFDGVDADDEGMVFALTTDGDSLWSRRYSGDEIEGIFSLPDGGFVAAGRDRPFFWLFKADFEGEVEWEHVYDEIGIRFCSNAAQTSDGGYILVGETGRSICAVKTDVDGELEWWHRYENDSLSLACYGVAQTSDGGFILTGYGRGRLEHGYSVRTDADGEVLWDATYNYRGATWFWSAAQTLDGGFVFAGDSYIADGRAMYMVRTDEHGEQLWEVHYGRSGDVCTQVLLTADGGYALAGNTSSYHRNRRGEVLAGTNFWLVKTGPDPVNNAVTLLDPAFPNSFAVQAPYPNPFNSTVTIGFDLPRNDEVRVAVYDMNGREIDLLVNSNLNAGHHKFAWNATTMPAGVYFLNLTANGQSNTKKVALVR